MGSVSTSVGCAVGIPIGVGIIIAFAFWYRLQRRFKKELEDDKDLEHEIYDDTAYISFNNLDSLKKDTQQSNNNNNNNLDITLDDDDDDDDDNNSIIHDHNNNSNNNNNIKKNRPKNNMYIPAYRRKINSLHHQSIRMINNKSSSNNPYSTNIESENTINIPPPILSRSSLKSPSLQNIHDPQQQQQVRQISTYDQMVPLVNPSSIFDSKNNINDHISFQSDSTYKNDSFNIRSLQYQDLGSYYPAVPNSTNNSIQNYKFNLSTSSLNNSTNIFSTPNSKKNHVNTIHANEDNSKIMDSTQNDVESDYILKNNYDINDSESKIVEEDQYENEFTNYKENRRQFLDSLRPTNIE
ncbi:Skg1p PWA37_004705 [Arxiozyma heterogenica]|uniref:Skg1p n=1 Tax=Arxiozyma heterogenica TaxID=278026 RepID=UPI002F152D3A